MNLKRQSEHSGLCPDTSSLVCICEEGGVWDGIGSFEMNPSAIVLLISKLILLQYQNIKLSIQAVLD